MDKGGSANYHCPSGRLILYTKKIEIEQLDLAYIDNRERKAGVCIVVSSKAVNKFIAHMRMSNYPDFFFRTGPLTIRGQIIKRSVAVNESSEIATLNMNIRGLLILHKKGKGAT